MNALYVARKVFRQFIRDRRTMALIFVVPVAIMTIYYFLLRDDLSVKLTLAVISSERDTPSYKALADVLGGQKNIGFVEDPGPTAAEAIDRTGADAAIELPAGFFAALAKNEEPRFAIRIEGTKSGVEATVTKIVDAALARARLASIPFLRNLKLTSGAIADVSYHYPTRGFRLIDLTAPAFIAFFLYFITFLLTCVAFLRERSSGTLERILVSPLSSEALVLGYLLAFFVLGSVQGAFLIVFSKWVLGIQTVGGLAPALAPMLVTVLLGVTMGIFFSELAKNEFQVIQFIPIVIIPQVLLSGILFDVSSLPAFFRPVAAALPLTYTANILKGMLLKGQGFLALGTDFLALSAFLLGFTGLSFLVARRAR
ncbi:MAG: ABC transporter permease [Spirochaetes bacterium]|nr:ABC transporter permease [Spirochaetota bacterium]